MQWHLLIALIYLQSYVDGDWKGQKKVRCYCPTRGNRRQSHLYYPFADVTYGMVHVERKKMCVRFDSASYLVVFSLFCTTCRDGCCRCTKRLGSLSGRPITNATNVEASRCLHHLRVLNDLAHLPDTCLQRSQSKCARARTLRKRVFKWCFALRVRYGICKLERSSIFIRESVW